MDEGRPSGFGCSARMGKAPGIGGEVLKDLKRAVQRVRIFLSDDLRGLEETIKRVFPEAA
jgi:transposase-like protein